MRAMVTVKNKKKMHHSQALEGMLVLSSSPRKSINVLEAIKTLRSRESFSIQPNCIPVSCYLFLVYPGKHQGLLSERRKWAICRMQNWEAYDYYATCTYLGNPDKGIDLARPMLGGKISLTDGISELGGLHQILSRVEQPLPMYVARDEAFKESKHETFATWRLKEVQSNTSMSYPQQSSFAPPPPQNQNSVAPPPPPPSHRSSQYGQSQGFGGGGGGGASVPPASYPSNYAQIHPNSSAHHGGYGSSSHHYGPPRPQQQQQQQQQQYPYMAPSQGAYAPPPPPPSGGNAQPPPPPMYYPSSQYSQFNAHSAPPLPPFAPPPPPPSSSPPNSSIPPPPSGPPPSVPPPPPPSSSSSVPPSNQVKESRQSRDGHSRGHRDSSGSGWRESSHLKHGLPPKHSKESGGPSLAGKAAQMRNGPGLGRVETEEERRLRKRKEYEKQRQEEKHRQLIKDSQNTVLHKTHVLSSGAKGHGSMVGSRMGDKRTTPFLSGERVENRLKKPTTFLCKLKFRNELPDPTAQPKLLSMNSNKDQYTKYTINSLEKLHKPKLFVEPDLGIPLDLLDISVYNPPSIRPPLAPEDEELLRDDELATPVKPNGIRRKERPTDKGVSWLVKTQYISPLSTDSAKMALTEKRAKELREIKEGLNLLENLNDREKQIKAIEASFVACKSRPVHATNSKLQPVEILPLLPDFDRYDDQFVLATFDSDPTADSEVYSKLDRSVRDHYESQAIMKSFMGGGSEPDKQEKFLAYMVPSTDELWKDIYDESEEVSYSWIREYHWDVRGEDADDPTSYFVTFDDEAARYLPVPTKLVLRKKRAKEGRSIDEVEHYPVPSRVTVRRRSAVSVVELKDSGDYTSTRDVSSLKRGRSDADDAFETQGKVARMQDMDNFSGGEDDISD
ncbi:hypothetical protein Sjap_011926 [Stephania japonica]|uniref:Lipoxygenase domain-containing protein n=1 Tax=Stephania japonica TaxID=461633 RepID=A0AAP0P601_9MAGN